MGEEQIKKQMSDLKFSDFQSAGLKFDHTKDGMLEGMGIGKEEFEDMRRAMTACASTGSTLTEKIEATINADVPTKWKIVGLIKLGESASSMRTVEALQEIPDGAPGMIVKAMVLLKTIGG
jgi:hypothetical protein